MSKKILGKDSKFAKKFNSQIQKYFSNTAKEFKGSSDSQLHYMVGGSKIQLTKRHNPNSSHSSQTSKFIHYNTK